MDCFLGIDIGTSATKAALFDMDGRVLAQAAQAYPVNRPHPGWASQNPEDWWNAAAQATRQCVALAKVQPSQIKGVGVDGQSWAAILVDGQGRVLCETPIWMDTRAQAECTQMLQKTDPEALFRLSGNPVSPGYTTPKLLWYEKHLPQAYKQARWVLQSNAFIVYRLTGHATHDLSQGYGVHCFDMDRGAWDDALCGQLGLKREMLPDLFPSDMVVGQVTSSAAAQTGLAPGTPVVAGGLDAACGTLGAGVFEAGQAQEQGGQAGGMSICLDAPARDPRLILGRHVVPGRFLLQGGTVGGGGALKWFAQTLAGEDALSARREGMNVFEKLSCMAGEVPPGSGGVTFLPYMAGERSPIWDPDACGVFFGLDYAATRAHMARAVMEGVGYSLRHNLEIAQAAGVRISALSAMGGAANSRVWTQIKSDISGLPVNVPASDTATTLGAALLAAVGTGHFKNYESAVDRTISVARVHRPNFENYPVYDRGYQIYAQLYPALKGIMAARKG